MRVKLVLLALFLAGPLPASQIIIEGERVQLDPANCAEYGFRVEVELFDPVTDEYSIIISAPHESMQRTFSHYYIGRIDSLAVEVASVLSNDRHAIQIYLPLDGFDVDETEITAVFKSDGKTPVFFGIDAQHFIGSTNTDGR